MSVTYFYNTHHRQAYVSFRVCKISISHLKMVNSHIYKTIYAAIYNVPNFLLYNIFQIQCDNRVKLQGFKLYRWEILI